MCEPHWAVGHPSIWPGVSLLFVDGTHRSIPGLRGQPALPGKASTLSERGGCLSGAPLSDHCSMGTSISSGLRLKQKHQLLPELPPASC